MQRPEMRPSERNEAYNLPLHPIAGERRREATPPEAQSLRKEAKIAKYEAEEVTRSKAQDLLWP